MKKVIILFVMFCSFALAQGWNNTVTTSINEPNLDKMDLFTNIDGNHILIKRSDGTIIYYNINSSGTVNGSKTETLESSGDFPNIVGSNDKIYAIYKSGNYIKGKYSTNGGTDWSTVSDLSTTSNTCNGVDAIYETGKGTHLVWATKDSDPYYETNYYLLNISNSWVNGKTVTDYDANEVGGFPTVTFSNDRVHVSYNTGTSSNPVYNQGEAKTRDRYDGTWQTPQMVFDDKTSGAERLFSNNNYLFDFYYKFIEDMGGWHFDNYVKQRTVGGTTWSSSTLIESMAHPGNLISAIKTNDGNIHITYEYLNGSSKTINHKYYNGSNWSSGYGITSGASYYKGIVMNCVSNDLYVTFKQSSSDYVKYCQYDAAPLAPQNFNITQSSAAHPLLSWSENNEPDVDFYVIEKVLGELGWQPIDSTTDLYYEDVLETYCTGRWCDGGHYVWYRVKAVDYHPNESLPSEEISTWVNGFDPYKINPGFKIPSEYSLRQNFPNPFNPTTKISYSLQKDGLVSIKVYDVLGNEVAVLVNEVKPEGYYEVELNADNLPSGVYIYKMQSENFTAVHKMILMR